MGSNNLNRRELLRQSTLAAAVLTGGLGLKKSYGQAKTSTYEGKKVIVIGIDGMDPRLSERMMTAGELPNCDDDIGNDSDSSYKDDELFKSMTKNKIKKISLPKNTSSKVIKKRVRNRFGSDTCHMGFVKQFVENEQTGRAN